MSKTYFGLSRPNSWDVLGSMGCGFSSDCGSADQGQFDGGFRLGVQRHQISVDVDRAADVVGENVPEGVVEGFLDLGLQDFAGELVGDRHQQGGTDQALRLGEDDEAALPGCDAVVFSRRLTTRRQELPTVLAWLASSTVINRFLKLACLHYAAATSPEPVRWPRLNPQGYAQSVDNRLLSHSRG